MENKVLDLIKQYEILEKDTEDKEKAWGCNPSNYQLECIWDLAYGKECEISNLIVSEIVKATNTSYRIAMNMLINHREELIKILSKEK